MSFADDLKAAQEVPVSVLDVDVTVNGNLYTLRFTQMDPYEWATEVDLHPARPGVQIDKRYGYNLRSLVRAVAPRTGVLVEGDTTVELSPEQWTDLFKPSVTSGNIFQRITDAIWSLNEFIPERQVEAAKKARAASAEGSA